MHLYRCSGIPLIIGMSYLSISLTFECAYHYGVPSAYGKLSESQPKSGPIMRDPNLKAEIVFRGINFPTSMAFLGDNDILILEKNEGTVRRVVNGIMLENPLLKVNVSSAGERGMLGIAIANGNKTVDGYIFLYLTEDVTNENPSGGNNKVPNAKNRLYRYELIDNRLTNPKLLLDLPAGHRNIHNGGVVTIGPDNNLYVIVGDMLGTDPQENERPDGRGSILRIDQEGNAVKNRSEYLLGNTHPLNKYFAYGIRNSFGMDFDPITGNLWDEENGPNYGDEINLVEPGFNSGWRSIQGSEINVEGFSPNSLNNFNGRAKYSDPEFAWKDSIGLTALKFLNSERYGSNYRNNMFVGDFHNGFIYDFTLNEERTELKLDGLLQDKIANGTDEIKPHIFGHGFGGIVDIEVGLDGYLYVLSLYQGGDNCAEGHRDCIEYESEVQGTIFRIIPRIAQ